MNWFLAPSLVQLWDEINDWWPERDKASDGSIGNAEHSARVSDHNPDEQGMVHAIDIDKDGIDVDLVLSRVIGDHRVNYVIYNRQIFSRVRGFKAIPYTGVNAHKSHIHVSIMYQGKFETDKTLWLPAKVTISQELIDMEWDDKIALTEEDARVWNLHGDTLKYKKGSKVSVGEMLRYPTLARKTDIKVDALLKLVKGEVS